MSLIAEYKLSNPILQETRRALPDLLFSVEDEHLSAEKVPKLVFWMQGPEEDLEQFEELFPDDPTIESHERLADLGQRRLYQVTISEAGLVGMTYLEAIELGITFLDIRGSDEGMYYRAQIPSRETLSTYQQLCEERELGFRLRSLYQGEGAGVESYGVTARQREVLRTALEAGYFDVPRRTTLEDLAGELGVSGQALSALLRRGQANLLRRTIATDLDT
ncbi:helix-turn-helix domain-containing protein [Natrialbaceae archaeon A-gly3]